MNSQLSTATMHSLKSRFRSKRRLHSASSSTAGSVSDLEDRVVMLCEDIPQENSFDSDRGSHQACSSRVRRSGSGAQDHSADPHTVHLSRDRLSYRQACYMEKEPPRGHGEFYVQRVMQVYGQCYCLFGERLFCVGSTHFKQGVLYSLTMVPYKSRMQ